MKMSKWYLIMGFEFLAFALIRAVVCYFKHTFTTLYLFLIIIEIILGVIDIIYGNYLSKKGR